MVMLLKVRFAKPVLVTTTRCTVLVEFTVCGPKASAAGARLMPGTAAAVPLPVRPMTCGEPGALLTMVMLPVRAPAVSGVKVILIGQAMLTASELGLSGQVVVKPKSPLAVMLVMVSSAVPELPSDTVLTGLVVLTVRAPKLTDAGARLTAGEGAAVTVRLAVLVLVLVPAPAVNAPGMMVAVYVAEVALCTEMAMLQLPSAGMLPIPKE